MSKEWRPNDYTVEIDAPDPETPCECSGCDWKGPARDTTDIEDCSLTPGDPSPVGRCPDIINCNSLCYVIKPEPADTLRKTNTKR